MNKKFIQNNFSKGRFGETVEFVVLHTYGGKGRSLYNWFNSLQSKVSAHYAVFLDGEVEQYVDELDTAWHAGNWWFNTKSIGIEHQDDGNYMDSVRTDKLYTASINLISDIFIRYGWSWENVDYHIKIHRDILNGAVACPGGLNVDKIKEGVKEKLKNLAQEDFFKSLVLEEKRFIPEKAVNLYNIDTMEILKTYQPFTEFLLKYRTVDNKFYLSEFSFEKRYKQGFLTEELEYKEKKEETVVNQIEEKEIEEKKEENVENQLEKKDNLEEKTEEKKESFNLIKYLIKLLFSLISKQKK